MKISELADLLQLKILTEKKDLQKDVTGVYISDLLSWVMSHANKGDVWITVHTHLNIVAVALLVEMACILVPEGIQVEDATVKKANEEGVVILSSDKTAYQIAVEISRLI